MVRPRESYWDRSFERVWKLRGYGLECTASNMSTLLGAVFLIGVFGIAQGACLRYLIWYWAKYAFGTTGQVPLFACVVAALPMRAAPIWLAALTIAVSGVLP